MEYLYNDKTQITEHFNVSEFKCKCGNAHCIVLNPALPQKLELLFTTLNCSKIIVNSGHRCTNHDKAAGGSGYGQHVEGNAADIVCYGQDGNIINTKLVACKAQDLGFGGIGNINATYTAIHLDVRTSNFWKGDEAVPNGMHTITNDYYEYYGISRNTTITKGIDVSKHNGTIDWKKVKNDGIQFAILRAGYGKESSQIDKCFEENYQNAKVAKVPLGAYWYSYATTISEVKKEAEVCLSALKNKQFEFPIYFDLEEKSALNTGKENCSEMVKAFCSELESAGYWAGIYMSRSPFETHITEEVRNMYASWIAEYNSKLNYNGNVGMWQKSCNGKVSGISGNVDINECYIDYPTAIKSKGLNGYQQSTASESLDSLSVEVEIDINGQKYNGKLNKA